MHGGSEQQGKLRDDMKFKIFYTVKLQQIRYGKIVDNSCGEPWTENVAVLGDDLEPSILRFFHQGVKSDEITSIHQILLTRVCVGNRLMNHLRGANKTLATLQLTENPDVSTYRT